MVVSFLLCLCAIGIRGSGKPKETALTFSAAQEKKILKAFGKSYQARKQPRIVVFINRELSEESTEWKVKEKVQAEITGNIEISSKSQEQSSFAVKEDVKPEVSQPVAEPAPQSAATEPGKITEPKPAEGSSAEKPAPATAEPKPETSPSPEAKPTVAPAEAKPEAGATVSPKPEEKPPEPINPAKAQPASGSTGSAPAEASPPAPPATPAENAKPTGTDPVKPLEVQPASGSTGSAPAEAPPPAPPATPAENAKPTGTEPTKPLEVQPASGATGSAPAEAAPPASPATPAESQSSQPSKSNTQQSSIGMGLKFESVELRSEMPEERCLFAEAETWKFQNGFLSPFISARAKMVDRNTIVRQAGQESLKAKSATDLDRMSIEMDALNKYADIFVEVMISPDESSPTSYIFKASAKDLKTGGILGQSFSSGNTKIILKGDLTLDAKGNPKNQKRKVEVLDLDTTSKNLALALMDQMSNSWAPN